MSTAEWRSVPPPPAPRRDPLGALPTYVSSLDASVLPLEPSDILAARTYVRLRKLFLPLLLSHKRPLRLSLGGVASLVFETRLTAWFQVQEELRFHPGPEAHQLAEVLERINPLIPRGGELRASLLFERGGDAVRALRHEGVEALSRLRVVLGGMEFRARSLDPIGRELPSVTFLAFTPERVISGVRDHLAWPALGADLALPEVTVSALRRSLRAPSRLRLV
ncbi:MAG: DUF3501 family protein [Polyangiaceae bacterium]